MFRLKKFYKFLFLSTVIILSFFSCTIFTSSIPDYLHKYSTEILLGQYRPLGEGQIDKDGNFCIRSDSDFSFEVYFTNPGAHHCFFQYYDPLEDKWQDIPEDNSTDPKTFYREDYSEPLGKTKITYNKDYLRNCENNDTRDISLKISFLDEPIHALNPLGDGGRTDPLTIYCTVNTPPEIFEEEPYIGEYYDDEGLKNSVLCFNLKKPSTCPHIYKDLADDNGKCHIKINNVDYTFSVNINNNTFTFDNSSFSQNSSSFSNLNYQKLPAFQAKDIPVYFNSKKETNTFKVLITDQHGLQTSYSATTLSTGKAKLKNAKFERNEDEITLSPEFDLINKDGTQLIQKAGFVTIHYKLNYESEWKSKDFTAGDTPSIKFYIPGGNVQLNYYQTTNSHDIDSSDTEEKLIPGENKLYVTNGDTDDAYMGGSADHPASLTKVRDYLIGKTEEWEISLEKGDYVATENDMTSDRENSQSIKTLLVFSGPSKVTIKAPSDTERAILNAKSYGRLITTKTTELEIENVNFTGGKADNSTGGAIKTTRTLSLKNSDIYSNQAIKNGNGTGHGAGIYISYGNLSLDSCNFYDNVSTNGQGGALYMTGTGVKTLTVTSTTVGNLDNPNKATMGGGFYLNFPTAGSTISFKDSVIGSTTTTGENWANESTVKTNDEYGGGGLYFNSSLTSNPVQVTFENTIISKNKSVRNGGGIYCTTGFVLTEKNSNNSKFTIQNNYTSYDGGGIYLTGYSNINYATIKNNSTDTSSGRGGGVFITSNSFYFNNKNNGLINCNITGNSAYDGGGIFTRSSYLITGITLKEDGTFTNGTTVSGNSSSHTEDFHPTAGICCAYNCSVSGFEITSNNGCGLFGYNNLSVANLIVSGHTYTSNGNDHGFGIATNYDPDNQRNLTLYLEDGNTPNNLNIQGNNWDIFFFPGRIKVPFNNTTTFNLGIKLKPFTSLGENTILLSANTTKENTAKALNYFDFSNSLYDTCFVLDTGLLSDNPSDTSQSYNLKSLEKQKHAPGYDSTSFQNLINALSSNASESNPGIIWFTDNYEYTKNTDSYYKENYSPAVFDNTTSNNRKKFIIFGNGKSYNANRDSSHFGSAIYAGKYNTIEIRNLTIYGGCCIPSTLNHVNDCQYGGGILLAENSNVILKDKCIIGKTTSNITAPPNLNYAANVATKGGGVYVSKNATFTMQGETCIRENCSNKGSFGLSTGDGSAIYIDYGGTVYLKNDGSKCPQILYNNCQDFGTIYCEDESSLYIQSTEFANNKAKYVPGIFFYSGAYFYNQTTTENKIIMHDNISQSDTHYGVNIHCQNGVYINGIEEFFANMDLSNTMTFIDFMLPSEFYIISNPTKQYLTNIKNTITSTSTFTLGAVIRPNNHSEITCKKSFSPDDELYFDDDYIFENWVFVPEN